MSPNGDYMEYMVNTTKAYVYEEWDGKHIDSHPILSGLSRAGVKRSEAFFTQAQRSNAQNTKVADYSLVDQGWWGNSQKPPMNPLFWQCHWKASRKKRKMIPFLGSKPKRVHRYRPFCIEIDQFFSCLLHLDSVRHVGHPVHQSHFHFVSPNR